MSLDVSDPHITMAYDALAQNDPLRWFLLAYANKQNQLSLCASGTGDLDELRAHVSPGNVHYGVFREPNNGAIFCAALAVIPETVAGVRRARALVHARTVASIFKTHQLLSVPIPEQITVDALRTALRLPPRGTPQPAQNGPAPPPPTTTTTLDPSTPPPNSSPPAQPFKGLTPPSGSPTLTPSTRSHRKPPPRLSMPPAAKPAPGPSPDPPPPVPQPQLSPAAPSLHVPSPEPSAPLSPASGPSSPWLHKPEAPLPPPSPPSEQPSPHPQPKSAFESDDDDSEEIDYGTRMAGPLADIANTSAPSAPSIGSIPDERSVASSVSLAEPKPKGNGNGALTPAQEEAAHAKSEWEARQLSRAPNEEDAPPAPPSKDTSQRAPPRTDSVPLSTQPNEDPFRRPAASQKPAKDDTPRALGHGPPPSVLTPTARRRAATDALSRTMADATSTHRRIASQDASSVPAHAPTPAPPSSRFLERATPEIITEEQRLATLASERRRRAAERTQREREERAEEEARERAFAERKERERVERVRRVEAARLAEERRAEEKRAAAERQAAEEARAAREAQEAREREERAAAHVLRRARAEPREAQEGMELLSGFVTLEFASVWRRRYFRLTTEAWVFFRSDKDVAQPVHVLELGRVRALREWHEGYGELEAIPHSFAVEVEADGPWQCFADSAEDKEILLGLLNQAAGL